MNIIREVQIVDMVISHINLIHTNVTIINPTVITALRTTQNINRKKVMDILQKNIAGLWLILLKSIITNQNPIEINHIKIHQDINLNHVRL